MYENLLKNHKMFEFCCCSEHYGQFNEHLILKNRQKFMNQIYFNDKTEIS